MKKSSFVKTIILLTFFSVSARMYSETFRVSKVHEAKVLQEQGSEATARLNINDALAIKLPEDRDFIEGLELKFEIPEAVAYWMDCVACSVYSNIKPTPSSSQIDYSGTRVYVSTLPGKLSWVLQIPLKKENSLKSNNYTTKVDSIVEPSGNAILVRLQPVMKGVPEETLNSIIPITVKPILSNKGLLELKANDNGEAPKAYSVFIDDKIAALDNGKIILDGGIHNISIISEFYRNEMRTVRIEIAKTTLVQVDLKSIEPTLIIQAPEGSQILLDDAECKIIGQEFLITEGEHKINFKFGNYEILRTITAIKGKTYKASFSMDFDIEEE